MAFTKIHKIQKVSKLQYLHSLLIHTRKMYKSLEKSYSSFSFLEGYKLIALSQKRWE